MGDTIIFMSAYETTQYSKSRLIFKKKPKLDILLNKHHLTYMLMGNKLISSQGVLKLCTEYDYVQQRTSFSFSPISEKNNIEEFDEILRHTGFCIKLLHAQSLLADSIYFSIDYFVCMESFLVYFGEHVFQIDPAIFSMNSALFITFEVIDYETGLPLKKDDVFGKVDNYNLLPINGYQYFGEESTIPSNFKIPEIIYNNISNFFSEMTGKRFVPEDYSFIHNTLVLSNEINDVTDYICNLIGTRELLSPLVNISTTVNYQYYPQDGASVITNYNSDDVETPLYNGIMLESIKLYTYLSQIINMEITLDINKVIYNDLYLENLFFAPNVPIETYNLLNYIYKSSSFQYRKEATKLKISYMTAENESKKNRNGVLLNVLLYIISLIGAIGTLDTLECRLNIPYKYSFSVVVLVFSALGMIWGITEWRRYKRF
jgi:hypothetical protein